MNPNLMKAIPLMVAALMALFSVRWIFFKILYIAKAKELVDKADARKLQTKPVPVMGGIAVFFGVTLGLLVGYAAGRLLGVPFDVPILPVILSMVVMLYVGAMDDAVGLTPRSRFVIEILTVLGLIYASGGCIDSFHGMWGIGKFSWWYAVPITVIAGVGIINAVNMIDGVNGLSSTLCLLSCVFFGIVFVRSGDQADAMLAFCMAAGLLPFILHNVFGYYSKMFIGDAGTMLMGVLLTWFTICLLRSDTPYMYYDQLENVNLIAFALAVLCVPVFDTIRVMVLRIVHGKSPFMPDMTHLHHMFIRVGTSQFITMLTEVLIMLVVMTVWALSAYCGASLNWQFYLVVIAAGVLVWGTYALLSYHIQRDTKFLHKLAAFSVYTHLGGKKWWRRLAHGLDAPERRQPKFKDDE